MPSGADIASLFEEVDSGDPFTQPFSYPSSTTVRLEAEQRMSAPAPSSAEQRMSAPSPSRSEQRMPASAPSRAEQRMPAPAPSSGQPEPFAIPVEALRGENRGGRAASEVDESEVAPIVPERTVDALRATLMSRILERPAWLVQVLVIMTVVGISCAAGTWYGISSHP